MEGGVGGGGEKGGGKEMDSGRGWVRVWKEGEDRMGGWLRGGNKNGQWGARLAKVVGWRGEGSAGLDKSVE